MVGSSSYRAYQPSSSQPFFDDNRDMSPVDSEPPQFPPPAHDMSPPPPPVHRSPVGGHPDSYNQVPYGSSNYSNLSPPGITPGADNLGEAAAGGGINGIAIGVASSNERESGVQALRGLHGNHSGPFSDSHQYEQPRSNAYLAAGAMPPPGFVSSNSSLRSFPTTGRPSPPQSAYSDSPYNRYSSSNLNLAPSQLGAINPNDADDDDDWGMGPQTQAAQQQKRRSYVPFTGSRDGSREGTPGAAAAAGAGAGVAAGAGAGVLAARDASGNYNAVPGAMAESGNEKSAWLSSQNGGKKKLTWIISSVIVLVVIGAIVGGILGSTLSNRGNEGASGSGGASAQSVQEDNKTPLDKNSDEIKALMNNKNLHKVFPGMDYTPLNAQYPECLTVPASQNNITRDMAVMSQLTNAVRLYGTDCNQTEMVLNSIHLLGLTDMKVWLGVWLGNNDTTNNRQVDQMWSILDKHGDDPFKGIIIGNEVLYRKDLTETELLDVITDVKSNFTKKDIHLPIACADLGDNWTADMATKVDIVMSNVHPFFAGVEVDKAAAWTWTFWNQHDVQLTANNASIKQIIAEVGWPSGGGNDCGGSDCTSSTQGSIAGIDEMNSFMDDWICQSLTNGTEYFWFELFDEPWKIRYNEKGKEWEDKWGLMDINRNLKDGLTIPDCGGKTVSS